MTYRKRKPVSLEHLDTTIWRPVEKFGILIPDYYINKKAQIYSYKSHSFLKPSVAWHVSQKNVRTVKNLQYTLSCDTDLFKDYDYSIKSSVRGGNKIDKALVRLKAHIGCKSIWEPIDDYIHELGITKEDWVATPETVRQIVKSRAFGDFQKKALLQNLSVIERRMLKISDFNVKYSMNGPLFVYTGNMF